MFFQNQISCRHSNILHRKGRLWRGKRRTIVKLNTIDRFVTRLLEQRMKTCMEPQFLEHSFAYQEGKGILEAVQCARNFIENGYRAVVEIDLKDYFDNIQIELLLKKVKLYITDYAVLQLLESYLYCVISYDGEIIQKKQGIVQGNSISPILSNIYLHDFDELLESKHYHWLRFADNIFIYTENQHVATGIYAEVCSLLEQSPWNLKVNYAKSGVYSDAVTRKFLGYQFYQRNKKLEIRKCVYHERSVYYNWHPCAIRQINQEYHIVQDGVLNKKDYALLFENEEHKYHIPVEATQQINMYGDVTLTSSVLSTLSKNNIRIVLLDKYGNLMGHFIPNEYGQSGMVMLKQCELYNNTVRRLEMARYFEISGIHNMRANIRYYNKKKKNKLEQTIQELSESIKNVNEAKSLDELLMIEARARQKYYASFNEFITEKEFEFRKRTRRPPKDSLNAMISFGNVLLYNAILQIIWRTSLDPRIGIVHSTNKRSSSLNLDFADVFKPVIVDRVIFSLINCHQIKSEGDFILQENGIYLSNTGKRIFITAFEQKMEQNLTIKGKTYSYRRLLEREIRNYQNYIVRGEKYRPYKYY